MKENRATPPVIRNRFGWSRSDYRIAGAAGLLATVYGTAQCLLVYRSALNLSGLLTAVAFATTLLVAYRFKHFKAR